MLAVFHNNIAQNTKIAKDYFSKEKFKFIAEDRVSEIHILNLLYSIIY